MPLFYLLLVLLVFVQPICFAQSSIAEWKEILRTAKHDTTRMICYLEIAGLQGHADSMFYYARKGLSISKKYPNHVANAKLFNNLGRGYEMKAHPDSAAYYYELAHNIALRLNDDKQIKYTSFNRILLYKSPVQQISELLKMLKKYNYAPSKEYDNTLLFALYGIVAQNYIYLENIANGKAYLQKSRKFMTTYRDSIFYNIRYSIVLSSEARQYYQTADTTFIKVISRKYKLFLGEIEKFVATKNDNLATQLMAVVYGNYAAILMYENKHQESIFYINQATTDIKNLPDNLKYTKYSSLGKNYVGLGQFKKGIFYLEKAYTYYKNSQFIDSESSILEAMAKAYSKLGDYKKAYQYLEKASKMDKSYYGKQQQQLSLEVEKQFELAEKQEQIAAQELENKLKEEHIKVEERQKYVFIGLLILSLSLLGWAVWSYKKQKQLSGQLEQKRHKLEIQAQELTEANQTKDKIFAVLGHDLRSPLNDLKVILMLFHSKDITPSKMKSMLQELTTKMNSVRDMMNNLLQWSLLELKHQPIQLKPISIKKIIEKAIGQLSSFAEKKEIVLETNLKEANVMCNAEEVEIIVRNLLSNAIKFTSKGGKISIDTFTQNDNVAIQIKDSGVGIPEELMHETSHYPVSKTGTEGEKGVGLGLKISRELAKRNGAEIFIESKQDSGTEITLAFNNAGQVKNGIQSNQIHHV